MSASNELGQWYRSIPKITRAWLTGSVAVSLSARLGLVKPHQLLLFVGPAFRHLQVRFKTFVFNSENSSLCSYGV